MSDYITNNVYAHNCESSIYIYVYTRVMSGPNLTSMGFHWAVKWPLHERAGPYS